MISLFMIWVAISASPGGMDPLLGIVFPDVLCCLRIWLTCWSPLSFRMHCSTCSMKFRAKLLESLLLEDWFVWCMVGLVGQAGLVHMSGLFYVVV